MTAFLTSIESIVAHVQQKWGDAYSGAPPIPMVLPNDVPDDLDLANGFIYLIPNITSTDFASINGNNPKVRELGVLEVNIHTKANTGIQNGLTYAAQIAGFVRGRDINGVEMFAPTVARGEEISYSEQGKFWLTPLVCGFRYDEHQSIVDL